MEGAELITDSRRGLSPAFMEELATPESPMGRVLERVKQDGTLSLEIRHEYFNVYYRGGSIARIGRARSDYYPVSFDTEYFSGNPPTVGPLAAITSLADAEVWARSLPQLKNAMDLWFGRHAKDEREYQQLVVRDNNLLQAGTATDYFICDVEYQTGAMRFDLVAVCWPSSGPSRKNRRDKRLAVIELKVLDKAMGGAAGLAEHLEDFRSFLKQDGVASFAEEMRGVFNQKVALGLVACAHSIESVRSSKPEYLLLLVNHDPDSRKLTRILETLPDVPEFDLRVATACFAGYGLYEQGIYGIAEFTERFKRQICAH